ncbi:hypothetical protein ACIG5E_34375 [Kitasatospora sp. NPDC053057]|uniref:hypothetical protein n=1 Tax=Kitasatospora sp. NPDC053057 TaxID=3364062 RepID=UPI0037CC2A57
MKVRQPVALAVAAAALVGCSTQEKPQNPAPPAAVAADQASPRGPGAAPAAPTTAGSTTTGEPQASTDGATTTTSSPTTTASSPVPAATGAPSATPPASGAPPAAAGGGEPGGPVDVASRFTAAFYSYDWQAPTTLDPVERARPFATEAYLQGLRPTQTTFAARMTAAQETSVATVRTAAVDADAPPATDTDAFVTVAWAQHLTDHGAPADNRASWSLHLLRVAGAWRVDAVLAKG